MTQEIIIITMTRDAKLDYLLRGEQNVMIGGFEEEKQDEWCGGAEVGYIYIGGDKVLKSVNPFFMNSQHLFLDQFKTEIDR